MAIRRVVSTDEPTARHPGTARTALSSSSVEHRYDLLLRLAEHPPRRRGTLDELPEATTSAQRREPPRQRVAGGTAAAIRFVSACSCRNAAAAVRARRLMSRAPGGST